MNAVIQTEWGRWAKQASDRYWNHREYEDILAECYIAAWRAYERYPQYDPGRRKAIVWGAVHKAACEFLRSPRSIDRKQTRYGGKAPETMPLQDLNEENEPYGRDFAPALINALAGAR